MCREEALLVVVVVVKLALGVVVKAAVVKEVAAVVENHFQPPKPINSKVKRGAIKKGNVSLILNRKQNGIEAQRSKDDIPKAKRRPWKREEPVRGGGGEVTIEYLLDD